MDVAILHDGGDESEFTAWEYYERFGARGDHSTWLTCPECGRPVVARAMARDSWVDPYFKHRDNDPVAQGCSLFRSGGAGSFGSGGYTSLGEPVEMSIFQLPDRSFALIVFFPPMDEWALEDLERQHAVLMCGRDDCRHPITRESFPPNTIVGMLYGVSGSSFGLGLSISGIWPYDTPLPNIQSTYCGCMLFVCRGETHANSRYGRGNMDISPGNRFILAHSTVTGAKTARELRRLSSSYSEIGELDGSGGKIKVAELEFPDELYANGQLQDKLRWTFL